MYMDKMLEFSDGEVFASEAATTETVSTDIADLGVSETDAFGTTIYANIGEADGLVWHVFVNEALVGSSSTLTCELVVKASAASMSAGSTIIDSFIIAEATAKGTHYQRPVPAGVDLLRYMAVLYRANTGTLTSATIDSWIGMDRNKTDSSGGAIQT
jgi:hypothetical protein